MFKKIPAALFGRKKSAAKAVSPAEVARSMSAPRRSAMPSIPPSTSRRDTEDDIYSNPLHPLNPMGVTNIASPLNPANIAAAVAEPEPCRPRYHDSSPSYSDSSCYSSSDSSSSSYSSDSSSSSSSSD